MGPRALRLLLPLSLFALSACTIELQHDLSEDDANDIYVLLNNHQISANKLKEEGGNEPRYIITVPKANVSAAAKLLRDNSLPRPKADGLGVFKKMKGMIPTQTEERAMFIEALAGEVSNTLNRVPGVLEAKTIVMIPETNDLTQPDKKPMPSASVFVKYRSVDPNTKFSENDVKEFVAYAVPELKKEAVKVLMMPPPPDAEINISTQYVTLMGVQMTTSSADTFKLMVGFGAFMMLAMAGLTVFAFIRKPGGGGGGGGNGRPRSRTNAGAPAAEG